MPSGSITSTTNTFGMIPGTLTGSVGVPGPQGPTGPTGATGATGPAGPGVATGGTAGQYLTKVNGTNYNTSWTTLDLSTYAPLASPVFTGNPTAPTATFGDNDTSIATTAFVQAGLLGGTANARNLEVYVRNQSGSTIPAGRIVYISGATGNRPLITLAQANNDANSAQTMGFTKESIANNGFGYVIVRGELENIDTSALTEGVQLYLSPTTAGTWTTTKPSAPQHLVYVGIVVRAHPTLGVILVAVQNGYELNELHDVKITSASNGQVLKYDSAQGLWVNGTDSSGVAWGGITGTLSNQTDLQSALDGKYSTSNPSGYITSSALSPYLTTATAASTYQTLSGMSSYLTTSAAASTYLTQSNAASTYQTQSGMSNYLSKAGNLSGLASTSTARTNLGLGSLAVVNDAPSDGNQYARKNGAWDIVSGGGGGGFVPGSGNLELGAYYVKSSSGTSLAQLSYPELVISNGTIDIGQTYKKSTTSFNTHNVIQNAYAADGEGNIYLAEQKVAGMSATEIQITYSNADTSTSLSSVLTYDTGLSLTSPEYGTMNVNSSGLTFPDATTQNTAGIPDAPSNGNYYARKDGAWIMLNTASVVNTSGDTITVFYLP